MDHFDYHDGQLCAEQLPLTQIADAVGTPFYAYSTATILRHFDVFSQLLAGMDGMVCYAVKANDRLAILKLLGDAGAGADVVSLGEIKRAMAAGIPAGRIVFSGVAKTRDEMAEALKLGIFQFNVESTPELEALNEVAMALGKTAPVALRINPDVDPKTHAKISTGKKETKFGIEMPEALALYDRARQMPGIAIRGVSVHIGSQLMDLEPFRLAFQHVAGFVEELRGRGHDIRVLDLGGGFGIRYKPAETPPELAAYGAIIRETVGHLGCRLVLEPGRVIVGNAGVLVTRVIYVKEGSHKRFLIVDSGMHHLMRPTLYGAHHDIVPVAQPAADAPNSPCDIVGPICETGDKFAEDRPMPAVKAGDLLAIRSAGAYGTVMQNHYNSREAAADVLVDGAKFRIIRPRPQVEENWATETV
jgi:diaminopimelate decarboxylase